AGVLFDDRPEALRVVFGDLSGKQALLAGVSAEDVSEARAEHRGETVVAQGPDGVLTTGAGAEVGARDEHARVLELRLVQHEVRVLSPRVEERVVETCLRHSFEEDGGDDLVGVDVRPRQGGRYPGD